ncbi:MAG: hypothetical protein V4676_04115 [Bacteroidota bacterium]
MSDRAVIDAVVTQPSEQHEEKKVSIDLNKIIQQCLLNYGTLSLEARPVVRCSNLPEVEGVESVFIRLFDLLMKSILNHPPPGKQLFLHIDCERVKKMPADVTGFQIDFYTNVIITDDWIEKYQQPLSLCQTELVQNNAALKINYPPAHARLFTITYH